MSEKLKVLAIWVNFADGSIVPTCPLSPSKVEMKDELVPNWLAMRVSEAEDKIRSPLISSS
ncbi:hypothetical protein QUB08_22855 [Microcoleus sp. BR0-C5]|uniref:hypothetical protein n=1 Tax=Microcoleus sp. BR0-C5 TaxID=2818713 RepID=UPI002FD35791